MAQRWSRAELTMHVERLARGHEGDALVTEIAGLAKTLEPSDRALLEEVVLEQAKRDENIDPAVRRRAYQRGWFRPILARAQERAVDLIRRGG